MNKNFVFSIAAMLFVAVLLIFATLNKYKGSANLAEQMISYEVPESGVRYHTPEEVKNSHPIEEFSEFDEDMQEVFK
ncbi:hypothetical protein C7B80_32345 [Cyanosarcina cf. burmensis CCALA 770]|nr:hypothetical protein C7B80_32345 [Cyanosarcina cf. burmensis CCALA 770]